MFVIIIIVVIVIVAAMATNKPRNLKVSDLLQVTHTASLAMSSPPGQNESILIKTLGLNITAIKEDVHSIIIIVSSQQEPDVIISLPKGESWPAVIEYLSYPAQLNEDGVYPVEVTLGCEEAVGPVDILIYLKPEDVFIIPGGVP